MAEEWLYQIRVGLSDEAANLLNVDPQNAVLRPLTEVLHKHHAAAITVYDAFAGYVSEAEQQGVDRYPLYAWTKAALDDPAKREKFAKLCTLHVNGDEVYEKSVAEALEADLLPLVDHGALTRVTKHDSNPAHNPQPPARFRQ
ncbi:hypothetical protein JDN40_12220 [Rhodomicrobium vannielii ATCC 17100]|uniref:hypothetical protein n=1 Tax=Rhodomicrobium vannielii TaxID=1069 RepID=UPI00191B7A89|nr:hypothetical protein [Rhodomicrobium vannielii ATCC 17100]